MKKTEGKRTSVAEYVRKRACGESAGPGKEEVLPVCERSVQQEEVKSDLELLQACCKKEKYFLEMFRKASGSNVNDVRARVLKVQAFEQAIRALTEWLADYRSWGVWYTDKHIGAVYYKYDFENGAKLIVEEYEDTLTTLRKAEKRISQYYHLVGGPEPVRRTDGSPKWSRHENYTKYPDSESELVEFLKDIQK